MRRIKIADGTTWPVDDWEDTVEWRLRYGGKISRADALSAAELLNAYRYLTSEQTIDTETALLKLRMLRRAVREANAQEAAVNVLEHHDA